MGLLSRIEIAVGQGLIDLLAKLAPTECDPLRRVEDRRNDLKALLTKVFGDTAKILDPKFLTKAENAVTRTIFIAPKCYQGLPVPAIIASRASIISASCDDPSSLPRALD